MNKANMLKMNPKVTGVSFPSPVKGGGSDAAAGLEVRPCGMYVQNRSKDTKPCVPNIKVRVKYGSYFHEVTLSSQASFGNLIPCLLFHSILASKFVSRSWQANCSVC